MSSTPRSARRRSAFAATAVAAALAVTATACGPEDDNADAKPTDSQSAESKPERDLKDELGLPDDLPDKLPSSLDDLKKWRDGDWKNWDKDRWLREAKDFFNPIIEDLWDSDRMKDADKNDRQKDRREVDESEIDDDPSGGEGGSGEDEGVTDPEPRPVRAKPTPTPYDGDDRPVGKVFMDTPKGSMVCSGTVIADPKNPGKSNLVATAGHCVHGGQGKGWFRNVIFAPDYNPQGKDGSELDQSDQKAVAPHGVWWAKHARTTSHWINNGAERGGKGAQQDFAVMDMQPENKGTSKSLEETVGGSIPVAFNTPRVKSLSQLTSHGYPAAPPFEGSKQYSCTSKPGRLTIDTTQPSMYRIGCTMTAGASGGGILSADGKRLLSVNSIGPATATWLAGPRLGKDAKQVFESLSK
ncbi:hypothetical protein E0L36_13955 [Streptomyces sp. AJS327]|uniref:trypsin-like serine peptidase n=1 Tax=Streptomyces sp. AJS327 TaxID=2545265 RepID=UPI0015DE434A|nr:hypothetical protein [Streptomyces sp. AJS327]MBA0051958.1 hypothetical protein [Streptomyces sp. AJS327]